jgi:hypothetical protein
MSNDAFGPGPVSEWDDLRTFGLAVSVPVAGPLSLTVLYDSYTWRAASAAGASRIDELSAQLDGTLLDATAGGVRFLCSGAVGLGIDGNLEGMALQLGVHESSGISRPVPASYDAYSTPSCDVSAGIKAEYEGWPLAAPSAFAWVQKMMPGSLRVDLGVELGADGADTSIRGVAYWRYSSVESLSPTLDAAARFANGPVIAMTGACGFLSTSVEVNLLSGVSDGSFGIRFGGSHEAGAGAPLPLALEVSAETGCVALGRRFLVPLFGTGVRAYVGAIAGWWGSPADATTALRYSEYSTGIEGRIPIPMGSLEAELACSVGPVVTFITVQPIGEARSCIADLCARIGARIEPALRIGFVDTSTEGSTRHMGLGASLAWTPRVTVLPFAACTACAERETTVRIFAFSESR